MHRPTYSDQFYSSESPSYDSKFLSYSLPLLLHVFNQQSNLADYSLYVLMFMIQGAGLILSLEASCARDSREKFRT